MASITPVTAVSPRRTNVRSGWGGLDVEVIVPLFQKARRTDVPKEATPEPMVGEAAEGTEPEGLPVRGDRGLGVRPIACSSWRVGMALGGSIAKG